jgi:hypothetical protein
MLDKREMFGRRRLQDDVGKVEEREEERGETGIYGREEPEALKLGRNTDLALLGAPLLKLPLRTREKEGLWIKAPGRGERETSKSAGQNEARGRNLVR